MLNDIDNSDALVVLINLKFKMRAYKKEIKNNIMNNINPFNSF
jgi:hypothetical protein